MCAHCLRTYVWFYYYVRLVLWNDLRNGLCIYEMILKFTFAYDCVWLSWGDRVKIQLLTSVKKGVGIFFLPFFLKIFCTDVEYVIFILHDFLSS